MFDKVLNDLKYSSKEELNKKLAKEDEVPVLVFQEMCKFLKLDSEKIECIQDKFSNSNFYANAVSWFNDKDKINDKKIFLEDGKKITYDSDILNELTLCFIKYNADPVVDEQEVKNFLRGFIFNAILNLTKAF